MGCKEISRPVANAVVMPLRKPTGRTSAQQALRKARANPDPDGARGPAPADARLGAPAAHDKSTTRHRMVQRGRPGPVRGSPGPFPVAAISPHRAEGR